MLVGESTTHLIVMVEDGEVPHTQDDFMEQLLVGPVRAVP